MGSRAAAVRSNRQRDHASYMETAAKARTLAHQQNEYAPWPPLPPLGVHHENMSDGEREQRLRDHFKALESL
eukprot:1712278-Pleurochrysis_carterae.AAC.1